MEEILFLKKQFLQTLLKTYVTPESDLHWFLSYLTNQENILEKLKVVEGETALSRCLVVKISRQQLHVYLKKETLKLTDLKQIFHEIRFHERMPLYIVFKLPYLWENPLYLGILEENPKSLWNQQIDSKMAKEILGLVNEIERNEKKRQLQQEIDQALDNGDFSAFKVLTDTYQKERTFKN